MTRVGVWLAVVAMVLQAQAVAAGAFQIVLTSPKVALTKSAVQLDFEVSPTQVALNELVIETIVDTSGKTIASNVKASGNGKSFTATVDSKLSGGLYKMKVTAVVDEETKESVSEVIPFKVTVPVEIASANLNGLDLSFGDKLAHQVLSSGSGDALKMEVQLQNAVDKSLVTAHQVFLRFTHQQEHIDTYFVLSADSSKTHSTLLNFGELNKKFSYKSGDHSVQLIVGDSSFDQALVWNLGTLELLLGAAPSVAPSPLYAKTLLHDSDTTLKALPEIKHFMRPQDPRPPVFVSLVFAAAVLAPFGAFVLYALHLKLNINKLFAGSIFLFGTGFLVSLAAIFVLFGLYWIELTMFQTLGYLGIVGTVNVWFGHLTLKRLAQGVSSGKTKAE